jgi:hypothetical protein
MRYEQPDMRGWPEEARIAWEQASPEERMRSQVSIADLVAEDQADPSTPDHFDVEYQDGVEVDEEPATHGLTVASSSVVTHMRRIRDRLRSWGWTVQEMSGWETRGVRILTPDYVGQHHTAAEIDIDRILRDGRSDLNGPLCNFAVHRDGTIVLVAAGTANHFGVATINNSDAYGIEATGPIPLSNKGRDAFPNYDAQTALTVAIRMEHGWSIARIKGHKEVALPDGRKPDPAFEEGQPGDGYPAPYPEMDRYRSACKVTQVLKEEEDVPNTKQEIQQWVAEVVENKLGLGRGENMTLAVFGQTTNDDVFNRMVATNNPASNASMLIALTKSVADLLTLVGSLKTELSDDEVDIIANANANHAAVLAALEEHDTPPVA